MPIYKMSGSKDGKQKYRVRVNYTDALGANKQIDRVAYGASEAKELERQLNYELKQAPQAKKMTVQSLYEEYIASKKGEIREATIRRCNVEFENHILPMLKDVPLDKLTPQVLVNWKNAINEKKITFQGRKGAKTPDNNKEEYLRRVSSCFELRRKNGVYTN